MSAPQHDGPREAAVALPQLRLQILLRRRPEWGGRAVAVVDQDSPESPLLELSGEAISRGLRPGLRLGPARNADLELCTAVVSSADARAVCEEIATGLGTFTPRVEACLGRGGPLAIAGAFFVDPRGLDGLYGSTLRWATAVHGYLSDRGFTSSLVVGHHAQRCLALARASRPGTIRVLSPPQERAAANAVALRGAGVAESVCEPLARLGITTVGDLLALPVGELRTRFGAEVAELHRLLGDGAQLPLQPHSVALPPRAEVAVEPPTADAERLAFVLKRAVDQVVAHARADHYVLARMDLELSLERYGRGRTLSAEERRLGSSLEPASPSSDGRQWLELWRLRLSELRLPAPVEALALEGIAVSPEPEQLATAVVAPVRDPRAAREALARVAAALGEGAVVRLRAHDAHLPEASLRFESLEPAALDLAHRKSGPRESLEPDTRSQQTFSSQTWGVLRRLVRPTRLEPGTDGWPRCDASIVDYCGPHRISGGWWGRVPEAETLARDYWYLHLADGQIWWVFHDRVRSAWFLQARVG